MSKWESADKRAMIQTLIILALLVLALCLPGYQG
jgi:predicted nucleic acid-binding Zn ribbon protein